MNQAEKKNKKTKGKKYKKELILPLYFGWELVLRKVSDLKKHIVGPFKEYWQYLTAVLILIVIVSTALILKNNNPTLAATYGWIQSTWSGGASTTAVATHTNNQSNWTQYYSADDNISTSSNQLTLSSGSTSAEDTATGDFDAGADTNGDAPIIHTGDELKLSWTCGTDSVTYSGETYPTVLIGTQCWLAKNLNVGTYVTGATEQTDNSTIEKYCYSNNTANCTTYGGLYQWDEMMQYVTTEGAQGICPTGWHIPTDGEQNTLDQFLATGTCDANRGGTWDCNPAGTALKSGGSSGFNGLLAGYRSTDGSFNALSTNAYFWSSSESGANAWLRDLNSAYSTVYRNAYDQAYGFSVRCLKD